MDIWNKLEKLRNKPEPARQAIALALAIVITTIIIGIWLYLKTLPQNPTPSDLGAPSPFQLLWNYTKDLWK